MLKRKVKLLAVFFDKKNLFEFSSNFYSTPSIVEVIKTPLTMTLNDENPNLNQYWYSERTRETLCTAIRESISLKGGSEARVAFLSTPSLYFTLSDEERKQCTLLDYDTTLSSQNCKSYKFYDFNYPASIDANLRGSFDVIVIDPPFISPSVWKSYAITVSLLAKEGAHIICTTVAENEALLERLFMCQKTNFQPSIPNLTYQYNTYANFESSALSTTNAELE